MFLDLRPKQLLKQNNARKNVYAKQVLIIVEASRLIRWYNLIPSTRYTMADQVTILISMCMD